MILSKIVSVFTKNIKNRYLSQRLNLTLKHLALQQGISKECVHWDIQTNSWTVSGSTVLASNATHTTCSFSYLSTYAVVRAQSGPATPSQPLILLIARSHKLTSIASIS